MCVMRHMKVDLPKVSSWSPAQQNLNSCPKALNHVPGTVLSFWDMLAYLIFMTAFLTRCDYYVHLKMKKQVQRG